MQFIIFKTVIFFGLFTAILLIFPVGGYSDQNFFITLLISFLYYRQEVNRTRILDIYQRFEAFGGIYAKRAMEDWQADIKKYSNEDIDVMFNKLMERTNENTELLEKMVYVVDKQINKTQ